MKKNIYSYAFQKTIPVMVGYLFLGAAYGILMQTGGYGIGWALAMFLFMQGACNMPVFRCWLPVYIHCMPF